jgi:hypothetical protein
MAGFLRVSHQNAPTLGAPGQWPFHHPAARRSALFPMILEPLLPDAPDVRRLRGGGGALASRMVIALLEAAVLGLLYRRLGTSYHDGFQGRGQALGGMDVGTGHGGSQRAAGGLHDHAPVHPCVSHDRSGYGPPRHRPSARCPSSSRRLATPSPPPPRHRTPRRGRPTDGRTGHIGTTAGRADAPCGQRQTPRGADAMGSRSAGDR